MIDNICSASLQAVNHIIKHLRRGNGKTGDHSNVDLFQASVCQLLNGCNNGCKNGYSWACEQKGPGKTGDRIDILGTPPKSKGDKKWVIEIDAARHDQLATKFVSRMAIMSLNKPINYVALLYPGPGSIRANSKSMCEKFVFFANLIAKKSGSRVYGIYIDVDENKNEEDAIKDAKIELWDFSKNNFEITKGGTTLSANSMNDCAQKVISDYLGNPPTFDFSVLDTYFTGDNGFHFIIDDSKQTAVKKSYTGSVGKTSDGKDVMSYSQFRNDNGSQAHWPDFESICTSLDYTIKRKWTIYKFDKNLDNIDKVDPTGTIKLNKLTVPCISNCSYCPLNGGCASSKKVILNCSCLLNQGKSGDKCASAKSGIIQ